jgi:putative ABC transport system substrate-binding protein
MRRREVVTWLGGAALVWPVAARAQQSVPVIGLLHSASPSAFAPFLAALREGLGRGRIC